MEITELAYMDDSGYHFADYQAFLTWRNDQLKAIYGADTYIDPDSQDGQLLAIQALADYQTAARGGSIYNSFSPLTSQGVGLSRNVKINGLKRQAATFSTVDLTLVGTSGTVITNGIAKDSLEQKWILPASVTIPIGGTIDVEATAEFSGAVTAEAGTITSIFTPTLGWQTVNNDAAAAAGLPFETDAQLRIRQSISTANPSNTVMEGTVGAVANLTGVTKIQGYENDTDTTDADGIPEHSICLVVAGGDDVEIAETIALHKTPGTGTFGDDSELVTDSKGMPLLISFQRPDPITIDVEIAISVNSAWSSDYEVLIQEAVAAAITAVGIGDTVLITKLYIPAYLVGTPAAGTFDIATLEIARSGDPLGTSNIDLTFDEQAVCTIGDVNVVIS